MLTENPSMRLIPTSFAALAIILSSISSAHAQRNRSSQIKPDLTVESVQNRNNILHIKFKNMSGAQSPDTSARLEIRSTTGNSVFKIQRLNVKGMPPTKSQTLRMNPGVALTRVRVTVYVDPSNRVAESNEGNNFKTIQIGNAIRGAGDLEITNMQVDKQRKTLRVTVRNNSIASIRQSAVVKMESRVRLGRPGRQSKSLGPLSAGARRTISFPIESVAIGTNFKVTVDPSNGILESNESNNTRSQTIRF